MGIPLRVLIVEDSEGDAVLLLYALKKGGYDPTYERVYSRETMTAALDQPWDIVIADYVIPCFGAPEALQLIKERNLDVPFIIVSGAMGEENAVTAMKAGAHDYIMKDNLARLVPAIDRELKEVEVHRNKQKAEEEKKRIELQLLQAQKMEAVGRLTGGVAHDFNNLLTAIRGYTDMALEQTETGTQLYQDLKEIQVSSERAMNLTRQLLLFSRRQPMDFLYIDLNRTIEDLLALLHRMIGEDIEIQYELASNVLTIYADLTSIEQMIMNLVVNAVDAMCEGGKVTIRTEEIILDDKAASVFADGYAGNFIRLSVIDTGCGIDQEIQKQIFEPFFSTKPFGKGSGLGLSVVYGIVQQHKGWIDVISQLNQGSTFQVYFPKVIKKINKEGKKEVPLKIRKGQGERILVIEDENSVRHFAKRALEKGGYTVFVASDADEALDIFQQEKGKFDLIFSDVVLPSINGIKLIENFVSDNPKIKVILTSGYTDQKSQWKLIKKKGYPYLQKPYTFDALLKFVGEQIAS